MSDKIRVIRIVIYEGDRKYVEETVKVSIHGTREFSPHIKISAVTLGEFAEILGRVEDEKEVLE